MAQDLLKEFLGFRSELFGFIRAIVRNTHDAEDLFQEVARIILEKSNQGLDIQDFRAWAKEIARRQVLQHYRTTRTRRFAAVPTEEMADLVGEIYMKQSPSPEDLTEEYEALRNCLAKMPEDHLRFINLRYLADEGYDAIAKVAQKSEAAIRRLVARTRILLMQCVRKRMDLAGGP